MSQGRSDFPKTVADALAKRAAFICSNPDCRALTIAPSDGDEDRFLFIGIAAHICAAAAGGPRYDPAMTPIERKSSSNGISLCSNCATMIDKNGGLDFPVALLRRWKDDHEKWVRANLNKRQAAQQQAVIFNVTSIGQSGGITAGVVNVGQQARRLTEEQRQAMIPLLERLRGRSIAFACRMMDGESCDYATQLATLFLQTGWRVPEPIKTSLNDLTGYLAIAAFGNVDAAMPTLLAAIFQATGIPARIEAVKENSVGTWYRDVVHVIVGRVAT